MYTVHLSICMYTVLWHKGEGEQWVPYWTSLVSLWGRCCFRLLPHSVTWFQWGSPLLREAAAPLKSGWSRRCWHGWANSADTPPTRERGERRGEERRVWDKVLQECAADHLQGVFFPLFPPFHSGCCAFHPSSQLFPERETARVKTTTATDFRNPDTKMNHVLRKPEYRVQMPQCSSIVQGKLSKMYTGYINKAYSGAY